MLLVKTILKPSAIEGLGLFAAEPIAKGTVTWRFVEGYDPLFSQADIDALPEPARSDTLKYVYLNVEAVVYVYCLDNARFMNHADDPNTGSVTTPDDSFGYDVALRDIAAGEEMTCDYREFDADIAAKMLPAPAAR
ncbi:MAG: SET domain-containing protein-lysine N-methyltransferase [Rhizobiales bacterium]|nr:SET domain-containing protein-lysine N-methyltransferase [Hyphomicrobiales bacterium]